MKCFFIAFVLLAFQSVISAQTGTKSAIADSSALDSTNYYYQQYLSFDSLKDYKNALNSLLKSDSILRNEPGRDLEKQIYNYRIGIVYYHLLDTENSTIYWKKCVNECTELFSQTGDTAYVRYVVRSAGRLDVYNLVSDLKPDLETCYTKLQVENLKDQLDCNVYHWLLYYLICAYFEHTLHELMIPVIDEAIRMSPMCAKISLNRIAYFHFFKGFPLLHLGRREESEQSFHIAKTLYEQDTNVDESGFHSNILLAEFNAYRSEESAFKAIEKAKEMCEVKMKKGGKSGILDSYYTLINLYNSVKQYDSSYYYFVKADSIINSSAYLKINYSYLTQFYNNATITAIGLKKYDLADSLMQLMSEDLEKRSHWNGRVGFNLRIDQGELKLYQRKYEEAKSIHSEIVDTYLDLNVNRERKYEVLIRLGKSEFFLNKDKDAFNTMHRGLESVYSVLQDYSHFLTDGDLEGYILGIIENYDYLFTILERNDKAEYNKVVYDGWLNKQHYVLNRIGRLRNMIQFSPELKNVYDKLKEVQQKLSVELSGKNDRPEIVSDLIEEKNQYESLLAKTASNLKIDLKQISSNDLLASLKSGEVIIEPIKYKSITAYEEGDDNFGAFISSKSEDNIRFVNLFPASYIRDKLQDTRDFEGINNLYADTALTEMIFNKLLAGIPQGSRIYLVQNNEFSGINLNFLLRKDGKRLGDLFEIISISAARYIAEQGGINDQLGSTESAALFGNINYNTTPQDKLYVSSNTNVLRGFNNFDFKRQTLYSEGFKWPMLQNSSKEITLIKTYLEKSGVKVFSYEDNKATEFKFKEMYSGQSQFTSPGILHFSTHSFYSENDLSVYGGLFDNYKKLRRTGDLSSVYTGLVMAGANRNWTDSIASGSDDGILTAFELSQLNLSNTELVVLSACMTGHGQVSASEGVFGLRRAFKIAGANKMILSLWNVADYQTMELMTLFYNNLCEHKMYPRKALKAAQDTMRDKKYEPYYWAGFILVE